MTPQTIDDVLSLLPPPERRRGAELGVAEGLTSQMFLTWGFERLYLVDRWQQVASQYGDASFDQGWHNKNFMQVKEIAKSHPEVTILQENTTSAARHVRDNELHFIYVDADHSYDAVMRDITTWMPKLVSGCVMMFDDYDNDRDYGVGRAVRTYCAQQEIPLHECGRQAWFQTPN